MGMDGLPEPGTTDTAEICIEIEGDSHANWPAAFLAFKQAVRAALNGLESAVPGAKKTRTSGTFKKKRS